MTTSTLEQYPIKSSEAEEIMYPKEIPCIDCAEMKDGAVVVNGIMMREKGDNFYPFKYRCNKKGCHRAKTPIYGIQNTIEYDYSNDDTMIIPYREKMSHGSSSCQSNCEIKYAFKNNKLLYVERIPRSYSKKVKTIEDDLIDINEIE